MGNILAQILIFKNRLKYENLNNNKLDEPLLINHYDYDSNLFLSEKDIINLDILNSDDFSDNLSD